MNNKHDSYKCIMPISTLVGLFLFSCSSYPQRTPTSRLIARKFQQPRLLIRGIDSLYKKQGIYVE